MFRRVVGVELSGRFLYAAAIRWGWKKSTLEGVLCLELPEGEEDEGAWVEVQEALKGWRANQGRPSLTVASLPAQEGFSAYLHFPFRRISQARKVIKSEMEGEIPLTLEETVADFLPAPKSSAAGVDVFAVAVSRAALARHLGHLERLGLFPERVHFSPLAELRALSALAPELAKGVMGVVHVGEAHAAFLIARDGMPIHLRTFRRRVPREASPGGLEGDKGTEADSILRELQLALWSWQGSPKGGLQVERLVLTGEAGSKELARAIEEALGVPCRLISWEKEAGLTSARALSPEVLARVGACLGAGLSALNPFQTSFDLRREELMAGEGWRGLKRPALAAASAALVLGVAAYGDLALKVRREERRLEAAERQVRSVFDEVFPPGRRIVDPQSQLTARVQEQARRLAFLTGGTGNGDGPLDVMAKVSRAVPSALKVRVDRLEVDDMGVSLEGETVSFEGVDRIKSGLMNEPGFERLEVKQARLAEGKQEVHFLMRIPFPASPAGKQQ